MPFNIPPPEQQIDFSFALAQIRTLYLQEALSQTIAELNISDIDKELAEYVPQTSLSALAQHGLRGELVFATPLILKSNPRLLGYYRLLLGFSQKEFYTKSFGSSGFKSMEASGTLTARHEASLPQLCQALSKSASALIDGIGLGRISRDLLDDLTLLTLGPQLRGGANVKRGGDAIIEVFEVIHDIVKHAATSSVKSRIEIRNAAGRKVLIEFAADPDIIIREDIGATDTRNIIAIEVKGGKDFSNIHNRLGEAEKSHQKAKMAGYTECWTVTNVDRFDEEMARRESPSTNRFYRISSLTARASKEYDDFKARIIALTGIRTKQKRTRPKTP